MSSAEFPLEAAANTPGFHVVFDLITRSKRDEVLYPEFTAEVPALFAVGEKRAFKRAGQGYGIAEVAVQFHGYPGVEYEGHFRFFAHNFLLSAQVFHVHANTQALKARVHQGADIHGDCTQRLWTQG